MTEPTCTFCGASDKHRCRDPFQATICKISNRLSASTAASSAAADALKAARLEGIRLGLEAAVDVLIGLKQDINTIETRGPFEEISIPVVLSLTAIGICAEAIRAIDPTKIGESHD